MKQMLMLASFICLCSHGFCAEKETIAKITKRAPSIDGKLDEECWKKASFNSDFLDFKTKKTADRKTEFAFCFDDENLYLGIRCKSPDAYTAVASPDFWKGDLIECFIDPGSSGYDYFHFAATPSGMIFKERGYGRADSLWAPKIRAAGIVEKGEWTLEIAIPFSDFQFQKKCSSVWGINVVRSDKENGRYYTWAPSFGDLHQVSTFQPLKGIDIDTSRFLWETQVSAEGGLAQGSDLPAHIINHSDKTMDLQLTMQIWSEGQSYPLTVSLGTVRIGAGEKMRIPLPSQKIPGLSLSKGNNIVLFEGRDTKNRLLFRSRNYDVNIPKDAMRLSCNQKFFYKDETVCNAEARIFLKKRDNAKISFAMQDPKGKWSQKKTVAADKAGRTLVKFDLKDLAPGKYKIIADWKGFAFAAQTIYILERKLENIKVSIRKDGVTLLNGKPFFPCGLFMPSPWYKRKYAYPTDEKDWNDIKAKGFNVIKHSPFWLKEFMRPNKNGERIAQDKKQNSWTILDRINKTGLKVAMSVNQFCYDDVVDMNGLKNYVSEFRGHPAVLCWYLADEPDLGGIPPQRLEKAYRIIKKTDPDHPVCVLVMGAFAPFRNAGDIMMSDKYPIKDLESRPYSAVYSVCRAGVNALKPGQAFWMTPQFFSNYPQEQWKRCPTVEEAILMSFQALCGGAKGLLYFGYSEESKRSPKGIPSPYPLVKKRLSWELWEGSSRMTAMLASVEPFIMNGSIAKDVSVTKSSGRANELQSLCLRKDNEILVIICNSSPEKANVKISGLSSFKKAKQENCGKEKSEVKDAALITELQPWTAGFIRFSKIN